MLCISAAYASCGVYPSVTFVYCVKTAKDAAIVAMQREWKTVPRFRMVPFSVTFSVLVKYSLTPNQTSRSFSATPVFLVFVRVV